MTPGQPSRQPRANRGWHRNHEEDPWTRAEREHAEQQAARAQAKATPPPAPFTVKAPPVTPPVTPAINPPRQHRTEQSPIHRAFETLRQTAGSTVHSIPASVHTPPPVPSQTELIQLQRPDTTNPMTQSSKWSSQRVVEEFSSFGVSPTP